MQLCWAHCTEISWNRNLSSYLGIIWKTSLSLEKKGNTKILPGRAHRHLWTPGISSLCSGRKCQCHVNGFYFCLIMLLAGKPRVSMAGCSVAVSQCLTGGFVLSLSGSPDWKEGYGRGWGLGRRARTANSVNPPWILAFSFILPPFPLSSFLFFRAMHCFSLLFLTTLLTKLDPRTTGPRPRTGVAQPAYQRLPQRSPDTMVAHERRKQDP